MIGRVLSSIRDSVRHARIPSGRPSSHPLLSGPRGARYQWGRFKGLPSFLKTVKTMIVSLNSNIRNHYMKMCLRYDTGYAVCNTARTWSLETGRLDGLTYLCLARIIQRGQTARREAREV